MLITGKNCIALMGDGTKKTHAYTGNMPITGMLTSGNSLH